MFRFDYFDFGRFLYCSHNHTISRKVKIKKIENIESYLPKNVCKLCVFAINKTLIGLVLNE